MKILTCLIKKWVLVWIVKRFSLFLIFSSFQVVFAELPPPTLFSPPTLTLWVHQIGMIQTDGSGASSILFSFSPFPTYQLSINSDLSSSGNRMSYLHQAKAMRTHGIYPVSWVCEELSKEYSNIVQIPRVLSSKDGSSNWFLFIDFQFMGSFSNEQIHQIQFQILPFSCALMRGLETIIFFPLTHQVSGRELAYGIQIRYLAPIRPDTNIDQIFRQVLLLWRSPAVFIENLFRPLNQCSASVLEQLLLKQTSYLPGILITNTVYIPFVIPTQSIHDASALNSYLHRYLLHLSQDSMNASWLTPFSQKLLTNWSTITWAMWNYSNSQWSILQDSEYQKVKQKGICLVLFPIDPDFLSRAGTNVYQLLEKGRLSQLSLSELPPFEVASIVIAGDTDFDPHYSYLAGQLLNIVRYSECFPKTIRLFQKAAAKGHKLAQAKLLELVALQRLEPSVLPFSIETEIPSLIQSSHPLVQFSLGYCWIKGIPSCFSSDYAQALTCWERSMEQGYLPAAYEWICCLASLPHPPLFLQRKAWDYILNNIQSLPNPLYTYGLKMLLHRCVLRAFNYQGTCVSHPISLPPPHTSPYASSLDSLLWSWIQFFSSSVDFSKPTPFWIEQILELDKQSSSYSDPAILTCRGGLRWLFSPMIPAWTPSQAIEWWIENAKVGEPIAISLLETVIYSNPEKVRPFLPSILNTLSVSYQNGCRILAGFLGQCYRWGWGVTPDLDRSRTLLMESVNYLDTQGIFQLALLFENQNPPDWEESRKLLRKAAEFGEPAAQTLLALRILSDEKIDNAWKEAITWLEKAILETNYVPAMTNLAVILLKTECPFYDPKRACELLLSASQAYDLHANILLGNALITQDQNALQRYLHNSNYTHTLVYRLEYMVQQQPHAELFFILGQIYENGVDTIPPHPVLARHYYRLSAQLGYEPAKKLLLK